MKIVEKLAEDFIEGCSTCPECHYGSNMDSFKAGYKASIFEILKWAEELKSNAQDRYPHIITIRGVLDVLNREVEDENS